MKKIDNIILFGFNYGLICIKELNLVLGFVIKNKISYKIIHEMRCFS
ncbi:MAG: hypothetical protein ACEPOV_08600 [Hyphomicrobiales bacterium]